MFFVRGAAPTGNEKRHPGPGAALRSLRGGLLLRSSSGGRQAGRRIRLSAKQWKMVHLRARSLLSERYTGQRRTAARGCAQALAPGSPADHGPRGPRADLRRLKRDSSLARVPHANGSPSPGGRAVNAGLKRAATDLSLPADTVEVVLHRRSQARALSSAARGRRTSSIVRATCWTRSTVRSSSRRILAVDLLQRRPSAASSGSSSRSGATVGGGAPASCR